MNRVTTRSASSMASSAAIPTPDEVAEKLR